jgi:restriction system protein
MIDDDNELLKMQAEEGDRLDREFENLKIQDFTSIPRPISEVEVKCDQIYGLISNYITFIGKTTEKRELLQIVQKNLNVIIGIFNNFMTWMYNSIDNLLQNTSCKEMDWDKFKNYGKYSETKPDEPMLQVIPSPPNKIDRKYRPNFPTIFDAWISSRRNRRIKDAEELFNKAMNLWEKEKDDINQRNNGAQERYINSLKEWEKGGVAFIREQEIHNQEIDLWKRDYFNKKGDAVEKYCGIRLSNDSLPKFLQKDYEGEYNGENKILIVEHYFPSPKEVPNLKEIRYIKSKNKIEKVYFSESEFSRMYDKLIFSLALSSINGLFITDMANALDAIAFNGWTKSIDETTGHEIVTCILSIYVSAEQMKKIDLSCVDPQKCFKALKGISASKLYNLTAIAPILNISKKDKRFVQSHEVVSKLDEATNIAAMGWEDFEHLIREIFEKEFSQSGGEVKVTQASRDGGVDAVAFDPDPIRGGKIVIQAKRYTNTVGVSAVRDLYGTLINEGATKGILITTADYGPDAYEFAKGKPLTLLNGNNLLYLLEKHGHKAIIDLRAAKRLLSLEEEED